MKKNNIICRQLIKGVIKGNFNQNTICTKFHKYSLLVASMNIKSNSKQN